jgi:hypothetical protein
MEWIGFGILICLGLLFFAPDVLLMPFGYAFAGMMEQTKSPRLLHYGIALALFGPALIVGLILLSLLFGWLKLPMAAGGCVIAAAALFVAWVIAGIVLGIIKSRHKSIDEERKGE